MKLILTYLKETVVDNKCVFISLALCGILNNNSMIGRTPWVLIVSGLVLGVYFRVEERNKTALKEREEH